MDLQRLRFLKTSVQAVKFYLESSESLVIPSRPSARCRYSITKHRALKQSSQGNYQQLIRLNNNGRALFMKFQLNTIVLKRRKHTIVSRSYIYSIAFQKYNFLGHRKSTNTYDLPSTGNELVPVTKSVTIHHHEFLAINNKSILLVRHYSKLSPKIERWRGTDECNRPKLVKLVDCVEEKKSGGGGGGFFKNLFNKLFGRKDPKCRSCNKQSSSESEKKRKKEDDRTEDKCCVDTSEEVDKCGRLEKVSKTEDKCDVETDSKKANKKVSLSKKVSRAEKKCDVNTSKEVDECVSLEKLSKKKDKYDVNTSKEDNKCVNLDLEKVSKKEDKCDVNTSKEADKCVSLDKLSKKDDNCKVNTEKADCAKLSKKVSKTVESASVTNQPSNKMKPNSCNVSAPSDRLKQLDTLEKCIGTLQQLIKNLRQEEEMKRAASKPICPEPKKPACPEPKKPICPVPNKPVCPEPLKPACPQPKKPACPQPQPKKPACPQPQPKKPVCPQPQPKKPACPQPKMPDCPQPKKPICCSQPKKPASPQPEKPACPEPKKPACSDPKKSICQEPKEIYSRANVDKCGQQNKCDEEELDDDCEEEEPYRCGIIEDCPPPKRVQGKIQSLNNEQTHSTRNRCGKDKDEECPETVRNNDDDCKKKC